MLSCRRHRWVTLALWAATGCINASVVTDAAATVLSADAGSVDAGAGTLKVILGFRTPDGGTVAQPLELGQRITIDPVGSLTVKTTLPLRNYRFRLFDEADRVVESDDQETRSDPEGLDFVIAPGSPLKRGHRYALMLDPQTPGPILDFAGAQRDEARYELLVAGERKKAKAPIKKKPRRR